MKNENDALNFQRLMSVDNFPEMSSTDLLSFLGQLIDLSFDLHEIDGLDKAIRIIDSIDNQKFTSEQRAIFYYFAANAWSNKYEIARKSNPANIKTWEFEPVELQKVVRYLRLSIKEEGLCSLNKIYRCNVFTNLANTFDTLGRFIEAIDYWNQSLKIDPDFGMTLGNAGMGYINYSTFIYNKNHQGAFIRYARIKLLKAINTLPNIPEYSTPLKTFQKYLSYADEVIIGPKESKYLNKPSSLGRSQAEKYFRNWCLQNRLFLNPLNDLGTFPIAAQDSLILPSMVTPINVGPRYQGIYNQMKQEYVSARFLCYEGIMHYSLHFSDRKVVLFNTLDYPSYGLSIEKVKIAFRMAYSLFDKIAFFINEYFGIGKDSNNVYFKSIWFKKQKEIVDSVKERKNPPLRGLYWLSKDLFDKNGDEGFQESLEPEAQDLYIIRNHLEHKYLKIHEMLIQRPDDSLSDDLAYSIERKDFEHKTIKLLRMVRNSLIYLSLAI
ncbi:MAG: LA2681 family HEPN domain-containing protein, partial [Anaerolineaceae bacterium]